MGPFRGQILLSQFSLHDFLCKCGVVSGSTIHRKMAAQMLASGLNEGPGRYTAGSGTC